MAKLPPTHQALDQAINAANRPRYIENKPLNPSAIGEFLAHCTKANHWTNFGPVSQLLEERLTQLLGLSDDLSVVACSNATVALHTLAAMHQHLQGKEIRWNASAFGFYSSCNGILHTAQLTDCDQDGMLELDSLDRSSFDGLIVTNMFGQHSDLTEYQSYAKQHGKILLIDAAMGFQSGGHYANECISLHHTKPWGFGEGGCAIVAKEHATLFRDLLAFGHQSPGDSINRLATNGKISDIASAYILMRLQEIDKFREDYLKQFQRIKKIGTKLGLKAFGGKDLHPGIPANVPFLFPHRVELPPDPEVPARKYYHPLANTPVATDIYRRIVNVACHSDMVQFNDQMIENFLNQLLLQSKVS